MTFVWLAPLTILFLFSAVILFQDGIERRAHRTGEHPPMGASDKDEHGNA